MSVFLVTETNYDDYTVHGIFSAREKAEAYVAVVEQAEREAGKLVRRPSVLDVEEWAVDDLVGHFPVFSARAYRGSREVYERLHILAAVDGRQVRYGEFGQPSEVQVFARNRADALAELKAAQAELFEA